MSREPTGEGTGGAARGVLEQWLPRVDVQLRRLLAGVEHRLSTQGVFPAGGQTQATTVARVELARCAYLVTRVPTGHLGLEELTPRQREVRKLLLQGHSRKAIAQQLGISPRTVGAHLERVYEKCGVASQWELLRQGLLGN